MAVIRFTPNLGANPALEPKLLPDAMGVACTNSKPGRGDLRPWNAPLTKATIPAGRKTIYRMGRDVPSDTQYWLSWPTVVHAVVGGNADDTSERTYYTGSGVPKWTDTTKALPVGSDSNSGARLLGVPAPATACTVTATSTATAATTTTNSKTTATIEITGGKAKVSTSLAHGFSVGQVATVALTWTSSDVFYNLPGSVTTSPIPVSKTISGQFPITAVTSNTFTFAHVEQWTVPAGATAPGTASVSNAVAAVDPDKETLFYTYTYVSDIGEESAPNPAPTQITAEMGSTKTISNLVPPPSGNYGVTKIRVYRTQAGSSGAEFYFLREIASTLTTTTDDGRDLGEVMPSTTWLMPEASMTWLTGLWNGMMAGIVGRAVRFCEAYTYYAWPLAYEILPTNAKPVALATFGQTLVMLTDGNPSIITGGSPESMDEQPVEFYQSCVAPLSAVGMGHGVAWASPDGLAYVGSGGARLLTAGIMTREDWQALTPSSIQGCMYEGRYFGFYQGSKCFVFDPANAGGMYFLDFGADAVHVDALQDALFILNGTSVQKFDAGAALTATFKSKVFHQPKPTSSFACAEVVGAHTLANPASFKLYVDGVLRHTQSVTSMDPFRLPSGFYGQDFQIEVSTSTSIQGVALAHSMNELAQT